MNWYKDNITEWKEIIDTISREYKKSPILIEKDIIQSLLLFKISKSDFPVVFKGGTSLSKAYSIINRFSEDIDLSMSRTISNNEKKSFKEQLLLIANSIGLEIKNIEDIKSRRDYNKYIFEYNSIYTSDKEILLVETSYFIPSFPTNNINIGSYISSYCKAKNLILPIDFPSLNFKMDVQSLERTLIDKVFAICDYRLKNIIYRESRHLYDIAKILENINIDQNTSSLINLVRKERSKLDSCPSAKANININELLLDIINTNFYEPDYKTITSKLLFENFDYISSIEKGIKQIIKKNIF